MSISPSSPSYKQAPTTDLSSWSNGQTWPTIAGSSHTFNPFQIFNNPFNIEDLAIFDDSTLHRILHDESLQLSIADLASALCNSSAALREHIKRGFCYVSFSTNPYKRVHFRSLESALRCVCLFYAANQAAIDYLFKAQQPEIPYALLGFKQPSDYCWCIA